MPALVIDTDNALGGPFGDVDDGFALVAAFRAGLPVEAVTTVFGNTFEPLVYRSLKSLARVAGYEGRILRGARTWWSGRTEASNYLAAREGKLRVLALGPLSNVALALKTDPSLAGRIEELLFVATNYSIALPAFRFIDFNQWKDPRAMRAVFASPVPLTCIPCDVARRLRISEKQLEPLPEPWGSYLREHSRRWFTRSKRIKGLDSVPLWDLIPSMYLIEPSLFRTVETRVELGRFGGAVFGCVGGRPVRVVTDFVAEAVWSRFCALLEEGRT